MVELKIGDSVLFIKIKGGKYCGYEKEPYTIQKTINEENSKMFYIKNKINEFWTSAAGLILNLNFIATNDYIHSNNVNIKYCDGREEIVSESEYFIRYSVKQTVTEIKTDQQNEKNRPLFEQLSLF